MCHIHKTLNLRSDWICDLEIHFKFKDELLTYNFINMIEVEDITFCEPFWNPCCKLQLTSLAESWNSKLFELSKRSDSFSIVEHVCIHLLDYWFRPCSPGTKDTYIRLVPYWKSDFGYFPVPWMSYSSIIKIMANSPSWLSLDWVFQLIYLASFFLSMLQLWVTLVHWLEFDDRNKTIFFSFCLKRRKKFVFLPSPIPHLWSLSYRTLTYNALISTQFGKFFLHSLAINVRNLWFKATTATIMGTSCHRTLVALAVETMIVETLMISTADTAETLITNSVR